MQIHPRKIDQQMEKAITMLAHCVNEECRNEKPLILHGIRIGFKLAELEEPEEVVVAGILHDVVEDTNCKIEEIEKEFGPKVAQIVSVVTQEKEEDYKKRWQILMDKIIKNGHPAMILKLADLNDNLNYLPLVKNLKEKLDSIQWKNNFAMSQLEPYLGETELFKRYREGYRKIFERLAK
ncbi:MAG: hypothetical protein UV40_C0006G0010 [Parcubacteria group bacterium GW2011_GWA1_42_7]|nr:MAG: hypothetical protein UV34_C0017G0029 [Parcubacteria group bacterium GW2011_GWB1_42_6]KKS70075.1 MAG: hypothetical protein UV40_C0006G0010 [Parcubacteria group bacterium GW2011_GWA1_42_7]KKS92538.1 MAG: hypothetical protein UV67_C0002G0028 [Parcubacteria group bacterium GW2011_GWC1_43_12]